ncbi:MAG: FAD-binding oxidoreductase [Actinomycetota bacterium]|nr:FAD-binding oxidoreductase [Actinomycetota bacterium]
MPINRRAFLHSAGLGAAAAALAGCAGGQTTSPPQPQPSGTAETALPPIDFPALARKLSGPLITPGQPGYDLARRSFNPLFDNRTPAAVAQCRRIEDVQVCVSAAVEARVPIAARSGGHSYPGYSTPDDALIVDLSGLASVQVNADGTAVIGAGARLIDVYTALAGAGRCLPAGSCPSVGIAGLTLGGGIGVLSRKYGLTCDRLVSATVVTADTTSRTVSASAEPDLFWALRGGGGGNFGIVSSLTFDTVPAPELTVFQLNFPAGSAPDVLGSWQQWIISMPDDLCSNCNITGGSPPGSTIIGCYVGSASALDPLLTNLIDRVGSQPTVRTIAQHGYLDAMRYFAGCSTKSTAECHGQASGEHWNREAFVASSRILPAPVSDPVQIVSACNGQTMLLLIDGLGGAVSRVKSADTAFPHREALATVQIYRKTTPADWAAAASSVAEVRDQFADIIGGGGYVNYLDASMPNWARAYYGDNLARLRQVAQRYDPDRLFTFPQSLTSW